MQKDKKQWGQNAKRQYKTTKYRSRKIQMEQNTHMSKYKCDKMKSN